ncbi:MAG: hypothetical protein V2I43_05470 [Parvularcula sp.]|jgi:hypothetical protein|nr:hypothetical protein [Parvularcula sp.]
MDEANSKNLMQYVFLSLFFSSAAFIIIRIGHALFSSDGGIPYNAILSALGVIFFAILCYWLEGVQQAANSAKDIDADVIASRSSRKKYLPELQKISEFYEEMSAARQIFSVFTILLLKESISQLPVNDISKFAWILRSGTAEFISAAAVTAWALQLYPKRIARQDPLGYLGGWNIKLATILYWIGSKGVSQPIYILDRVSRFLTQQEPRKARRLPMSAQKVLEEFTIRSGYKIRSMEVDVIFSDVIHIRTRSIYVFFDQNDRDLSPINKIVHRFAVKGYWTLNDIIRKCEVSNRVVVKATRCHEQLIGTVDTDAINLGANDDDEDTEIVLAEDDDDNDAKMIIEKASTRLASTVYFSEPIGEVERERRSFEIETVLSSERNNVEASSDGAREVVFRVANPTEHLRIRLFAERGYPDPAGGTISIRGLYDEVEPSNGVDSFRRTEERPHENTNLGYATEINLPPPGSTIEVSVLA